MLETNAPENKILPGQPKYWCFISYRHDDNREIDRQWATWLQHRLETYEIPIDLIGTRNDLGELIPERIFPVFRDEEELAADSDLHSSISKALDESKYLLVLCSPKARHSRHVANEIIYFKSIGRSGRVLAAILEGEPNSSLSGDEGEECFPVPLQHPFDAHRHPDMSSFVEPIASDFRTPAGGMGWTRSRAYRRWLLRNAGMTPQRAEQESKRYADQTNQALLKIIAGILEVPLGALTARDKAYQLNKERRRARTAGFVAATLAVLFIAALGASIAFLSQREEARFQRKEARESEKKAIENEEKAIASGKVAKKNEQLALKRQHEAEEQRAEAERQKTIALRRLAEVSYGRGRTAFEEGRPIEAMVYLSDCLEILPEHKSARQLLFGILTDKNNPIPIARRLAPKFKEVGLVGEVEGVGFLVRGDDQLWVFDRREGNLLLRPVYKAANTIIGTAVSLDQRRLAVWHLPRERGPGEIAMLEVKDGRLNEIGRFVAGAYLHLEFSPDGNWLFAAGYNERYLWDVNRRTLIFEKETEADSLRNPAGVIAYSSNNSHALWIDSGKLWRANLKTRTIESWTASAALESLIPIPSQKSFEPAPSLPATYITGAYLSRSGNWALLVKGNELIPVYFPDSVSIKDQDATRRTIVFPAKNIEDQSLRTRFDNVISLPDDQLLIFLSSGHYFDVSSVKPEHFSWEQVRQKDSTMDWFAQEGRVLSPNRRLLVRTRFGDGLQIWDVTLDMAVTTIWYPYPEVEETAFDDGGRKLVALDRDGGIRIWSLDGSGWPRAEALAFWYYNNPSQMSKSHKLHLIPRATTLAQPQVLTQEGIVSLPLPEGHSATAAHFIDDDRLGVSFLKPEYADSGGLAIYRSDDLSAPPETVSDRIVDSFSPLSDGYLALYDYRNNALVIVDSKNWHELISIRLTEWVVSAKTRAVISSSHRTLLLIDGDSRIGYVHLNSPEKQVNTFTVPGKVQAIAIAEDGSVAAVIDHLGWIRVYDLTTNTERLEREFQVNLKNATCLQLDKRQGIVAAAGSELVICAIASGDLLFQRDLTDLAYKIILSEDEVRIAYAGFWSVKTPVLGGVSWRYRIPDQITSEELVYGACAIAAGTSFIDSQHAQIDPYDYLVLYRQQAGTDWLDIREKELLLPNFDSPKGHPVSWLNRFADGTLFFRTFRNLEIEFPSSALTDALVAVDLISSDDGNRRPELAAYNAASAQRKGTNVPMVWRVLSKYAETIGDKELLRKAQENLRN